MKKKSINISLCWGLVAILLWGQVVVHLCHRFMHTCEENVEISAISPSSLDGTNDIFFNIHHESTHCSLCSLLCIQDGLQENLFLVASKVSYLDLESILYKHSSDVYTAEKLGRAPPIYS